MTALVEEAIAILRDVPPDRADEIARAVLALAARDRPVYRLSREERSDIEEADAEIERGEIATEDEVRAIWAKYAL